MLTGVFGMLCGLAVLLFVKEPKRGAFDKIQSLEVEEEDDGETPPPTVEEQMKAIAPPVMRSPGGPDGMTF